MYKTKIIANYILALFLNNVTIEIDQKYGLQKSVNSNVLQINEYT